MMLKHILPAIFAMLLCTAHLSANDRQPKPLTDEERARGAAMLDTFAAEFMPLTNARYKEITAKHALTSTALTQLTASVRANGGDPAQNPTWQTIKAKEQRELKQLYIIRDNLFGAYCFHKMGVLTADEMVEFDKRAVNWIDTEVAPKKKTTPAGE